MKRALFLGVMFLAAGCAHQSIDHPSAVNLVVTASPGAAQVFGSDAFERMLKHELHGATMTTPRPLTLTVNIDSTDRLIDGAKASLASGRPVYWRTLFTSVGSSDSVRGGADQSSGSVAFGPRGSSEYYTAFGGVYQQAHQEPTTTDLHQATDVRRPTRISSMGASQSVVVGTYTITDGLGNVSEQEPIVMLGADPASHDTRAQLQSMRLATQYLADRVIAVDAISRRGSSLSRSRTH
jgi:hypothetical protein